MKSISISSQEIDKGNYKRAESNAKNHAAPQAWAAKLAKTGAKA